MRCHGWEAIDPHRDARRLRPIVLRSHAAFSSRRPPVQRARRSQIQGVGGMCFFGDLMMYIAYLMGFKWDLMGFNGIMMG